jgi:FlaA1/EpsC-like NDP-sugar epimerase
MGAQGGVLWANRHGRRSWHRHAHARPTDDKQALVPVSERVWSAQSPVWLPLLLFAVDITVWVASLTVAEWLRYDFDVSAVSARGLLIAGACIIGVQGLFAHPFGLYARRWRVGSFDEAVSLAKCVLLSGIALTAIMWQTETATMPRSGPILATAFTMMGAMAARFTWRLVRDAALRPASAEALVVIGAGEAAYHIVRALNSNPQSSFRVVALVDDDPLKSNLRFENVRVQGTISSLAAVVAAAKASTVLLAIPSADRSLIRRVSRLCDEHELRLLVLPPVDEMFGMPTVSDIRPLDEEDLLGRRVADIDADHVKQYITGKRVLVTGAGGSIGSELCRQLVRFEPEALVMLDRDESGLHAVQLSIEGRALLSSPDLVLADIRDAQRIRQVFELHRPQVVFHAAALKHLALLEAAPNEAWQTNVLGTSNVLDAAQAVAVEHFVNISTDKAADPTSVLGYSKRITERLTAHRASSGLGLYVSVRFGNVLGSRGSVLTTFRAQAEAGGPITVTHPEVTRYFMTVQEAVRLTIYAGVIGQSGEVMVLDMGEPVRIADVAARFADQHTPPLQIEFTGLRPGEKMHENLMAKDELGVKRLHQLISHVAVEPLCLHELAMPCSPVGTVTLAKFASVTGIHLEMA